MGIGTAPLDVEIATRTEAAVAAALTALRARTPAQCDRCGGRKGFYERPIREGWWRCLTCLGGTFRALPTPAEEAAATREARDTTRATVLATDPGLRHLEALVAADRRRDRRSMTPAIARGMHEALLHRADPTRYAATPAAREWLDHCSLVDLLRKHLELGGHEDPFTLSRHEVVMRALVRGVDGWVPTSSRASGYRTTSDLPQLLDNVARVLFLDAFADTVRSFTPWTSAVTVPDFRSTIATVVDFPDLLAMPEHAEYVAGSPFGPAVAVRLTKFGRVVQCTGEMVLRDDVAGLGQLQQALGVAAASVENDVVYDLLAANPVMADGQPVFSAAHGNVMTAAALSAASLATACAALATNSGHGRPAYLLVGTADGPTARTLVTQQTPPNAGDASGVLEVVQDDRITGAWYVTCDPHERPTLVTAHLSGIDGPELLAQDGWDIDARSYKGRDAFGAAVVSASSMVKTPTP
jgi:hypothetical protein